MRKPAARIPKAVRDEYARLRKPTAEGPWGVLRPATALILARALASKKTPLPGFKPEGSRSFLPRFVSRSRGWTTVVEAVDDNYPNVGGFRKRDDGFDHDGYGVWREESRAPRHPREGISFDRADRGNGFRVFQAGKDYGHSWDDLYSYAKDSGMASGPAYDAVRAEMVRLAERSDELLSGRGDRCYVGVKATVSRGGIELGSSSVWGYEWAYEDREMFDRVDFPEAAREQVAEAMADAKRAQRAVCCRAPRRKRKP